MPRSRAASMLANSMLSGPTKAPTAPRMAASTPTLRPTTPPKIQSAVPPKGGLAPPMKTSLARPKTPAVPKPSPASQGPQSGTGVMARSNRAYGKQQRKIRNALGAQAGNPQQRGGLPSQPIAGSPAGGIAQPPGASSQAADVDAQY